MNAPLRVLHLRDSPWIDGPGRTILETASHLDPRRIEYYIGALIPRGKGAHPLVDAARQRGLNVIEFTDAGGLDESLRDNIITTLDRHKIDILHSSEFRTRVLAQMCRMRRRVYMVTTAHGWIANSPRRKLVRFLDKSLLRLFDRVILVSDAMRKRVPRWWLSEDRAQVLHNALVLRAYGRDVLQRQRRVVDTKSRIVLLNVGRLSPEKGQDMLLRAVHRLLPRWPELHVRIAGIGPMEASLRELARSLQIEDRVEFVGYVADMPSLYFDSDLLVQSSYTEGLPNVILEAAFLKVPIVATAVGGTAEVVRHQQSAWLIRPDLDQLTDGIAQFLARPDDFSHMASRAHEDVVANFSFDVRTERLMQLYESLARRGG